MITRVKDMILKAWRYFLALVRSPRRIPWLLWAIHVRRAHAGELLHLLPFREWWRRKGIAGVIDVGAHKGEFASAVSQLLPSAKIISFEPQPECYSALNERMKNAEGFSSKNLALGAGEARMTLHRSRFTKSSSLLEMGGRHLEEFPWTARGEDESVSVARLDQVIESDWIVRPCMLKIDVQGFELEVLKGAGSLLNSIDMVVVETSICSLYENDSSFDDVYSFMVENGFGYSGSVDQLCSPIDGRPLQQDSVFERD